MKQIHISVSSSQSVLQCIAFTFTLILQSNDKFSISNFHSFFVFMYHSSMCRHRHIWRTFAHFGLFHVSWPVLGCCSFCFEHMGYHIFQEVKENITSFSTDILKRKFMFFQKLCSSQGGPGKCFCVL